MWWSGKVAPEGVEKATTDTALGNVFLQCDALVIICYLFSLVDTKEVLDTIHE